MKLILASAALFAATSVSAEVTKIKIYDHTKTVTQSVPVSERRCQDIKVPIYQQGGQASGGDVLLGAILGGLLGGGVSGKDEGAAIGALGGAIIANESAKGPKVTGYEIQRQCSDVVVYQNSNVEIYSHSTIRFFVDGKRYVVPFQK
ncbi:MAG TPA: hypothetical protein DCW83_13475 [Saprospirales bacterium]|jgi:uncharacterized protein YcfJ|nr:hypothetical protein [Saprospirales bacterium]